MSAKDVLNETNTRLRVGLIDNLTTEHRYKTTWKLEKSHAFVALIYAIPNLLWNFVLTIAVLSKSGHRQAHGCSFPISVPRYRVFLWQEAWTHSVRRKERHAPPLAVWDQMSSTSPRMPSSIKPSGSKSAGVCKHSLTPVPLSILSASSVEIQPIYYTMQTTGMRLERISLREGENVVMRRTKSLPASHYHENGSQVQSGLNLPLALEANSEASNNDNGSIQAEDWLQYASWYNIPSQY